MVKEGYQAPIKSAIEALVKGLLPLHPGSALVKAVHGAVALEQTLGKYDAGPGSAGAQKCLTELKTFQTELAQAAQAEHRDDPEENKTHLTAVTGVILAFVKTSKQIETALGKDLEKLKKRNDLVPETLYHSSKLWKWFRDFAKKESSAENFDAYAIIMSGKAKHGSKDFDKLKTLVDQEIVNVPAPLAKEMKGIGKTSSDKDVADVVKNMKIEIGKNLAETMGRAMLKLPLELL